MNTTIGVYDNHDMAVEAVQKLKDANYPVSQITIMGKRATEVIDEDMHIMLKSPISAASLGTGTVIGTILGLITGAGLFAIPGLGFLYGSGALIGAIAGFDFGLIGGGIASILATVGLKDSNVARYHDALAQGKFLLVARGTKDDISRAKELLGGGGVLQAAY
ncbi:MAG: general stress protein [Bacteroidota bacterium]